MIENLLNNPSVMALGWTLVHSLWLALSLALIIRIAQHFISSDRALLLYRMGLVAMVTLLVGSIGIFLHYFQVYEVLAAVVVIPESTEPAVTTIMEFDALGTPEAPAPAGFTMEYFIQQMESYFPFLVVAWLVGALIMGLRLAGSWMYLNDLGKKGIQNPTDEWNLLFRDLCTKMGIQRPVRFFISERVQEPITLRHLKPIVLFPIGLVTQLSIEQVEVVLLHELAHIKRWDYLVNWLQSLLELLFFYHPAVWWLSGQVRTAREHCCDDLVLQAGNQQKMLYAQTLTQVSAYSLNSKSKLAMSLSGNNNSFTFRVKRLFGQVDQRFDWQKSMISGLLVCFVALVAIFNASSLFADENEPINTELWDLISDEVAQMELEDEFVLETIEEPVYGTPDNPKKEPMILIEGEFVGYGATGRAKLDPSKKYEVIEFLPEWAVLDLGERARWGAFNYIKPRAHQEATVYWGAEKDALIKGAKELFGLTAAGLIAQDTTPVYIIDGVKADKGVDINQLDPENIAKVTVLKGKAAYGVYGSAAKYGAVVIETKNGKKDAVEEDKPAVTVFGNDKTEEGISENPLVVIDGVVKGHGQQKIGNLKGKDIATINVFKGESAVAKYGKEANEGVIEIWTKKGAEKEKKATEEDAKPSSSDTKADPANVPLVKQDDGKMFLDKIIIVDGVKTKLGEPLIENLYADDIKSISISSGEAAVERYGEEGKTGVIEVFTKAKQNKIEKGVLNDAAFFATNATTKGNPLIIINGKTIGTGKTVEELNINPEDIKTIDVLKDKSAIALYGEAAKDGAIRIELKKGVSYEVPITDAPKSLVKIRGNSDNGDPLYVVNGKVLGKKSENLIELNPKEIKAINVLKGEPATEKYGAAAADGVVEITTKGAKKETEEQTFAIRGKRKDKKIAETKEAIRAEEDNVALRVEFKGKVTVQDRKSKKGTYEVDKMSLELKDLTEADTKEKASHLKFSSDDGIDIQTFANKNVNQLLYILDGKPLKAGAQKIQNLQPSEVKSVELIESGPELIPYGEAAKYGMLKINTKKTVVTGTHTPSKKTGKSTGIEIKNDDDEFEDYIFKAGTEKRLKAMDPLVVVDDVVRGLQSKVGGSIKKADIGFMIYMGPDEKVTAKYGNKAKDGVVKITSEEALKSEIDAAKKVTTPTFQKEMEASLKVFPNPFSKDIRVNFNLPEAARTKVSVFNAQGQLIKVLQDAQLQAGLHQLDWNSERSPSGNYTVVIESLNTRISKTIVKQ